MIDSQLFTNFPITINPARPKQNQPATNMKNQVKPGRRDNPPVTIPRLRPRKPIHPPGSLLASFTSICPASSLVMTCSNKAAPEGTGAATPPSDPLLPPRNPDCPTRQ